MRGGYWRTLLRRLRHKIACGENTFAYRHGVLVVASVCAQEDMPLEDMTLDAARDVLLAEDAQGNRIVLAESAADIALVDRQTGERVSLGVDLAAFVDGLHSLGPPRLELGPVVEDWPLSPGVRRGRPERGDKL